jgi:hypothetical protein
VFKQGRLTIPPEIALIGADLLPPKPDDKPASSSSASGDAQAIAGPETAAISLTTSILPEYSPLELDFDPPATWDWNSIEAERQKGMRIAQHMAALDDAASVWTADKGMALGEF